MNIKNLSPEDKIIRAKKSEMEVYEFATFLCLLFAALFSSTCIRFSEYANIHDLITWMPLIALGFLAMLCAVLTVVALRGAILSRKQLAELKAFAAQEKTAE